MPRSLLAALALALALAPLLAGCGAAPMPPSIPHALAGQPLPEFQRRAIDGAPVDTKSLHGHVLVVKFFAKYCEPCKKTLPAVEALSKSHGDVAFVGIAEDEHESDVNEVIATFHLTFPVVHDAGQTLAGRYRVSEMPVTFVADKQGSIKWVGGPGQTEEDLTAAIEAAGR
jgi:cytochrome c biogenesis protein CcmG, thiol:disulfide interchange protein DsbE